jgi:hypothetical protein
MKNKSLEDRIQRTEDMLEIQNLMSKYTYLHSAGLQKQVTELFAQKAPGVRFETVLGIYDGIEGVRRFFTGFVEYIDGDRIGSMVMQNMCSPFFEVAGDGKTAKGVWMSPGATAQKIQGNFGAYWQWVKYACDFIKEDGKWMFWHMHIYRVFTTPFNHSWVENVSSPRPDMPEDVRAKVMADRPGSQSNPYSTTTVQGYIPALPEPYETFDEKTAY